MRREPVRRLRHSERLGRGLTACEESGRGFEEREETVPGNRKKWRKCGDRAAGVTRYV